MLTDQEVIGALAARVDATRGQRGGRLGPGHRSGAREVLGPQPAGSLDHLVNDAFALQHPCGRPHRRGGQQGGQPAGVGGGHPVQGAAHRPGAGELAPLDGGKDIRHSAAGSHADRPESAGQVLGLHGQVMLNHGERSASSDRSERVQPQRGQPPDSEVATLSRRHGIPLPRVCRAARDLSLIHI